MDHPIEIPKFLKDTFSIFSTPILRHCLLPNSLQCVKTRALHRQLIFQWSLILSSNFFFGSKYLLIFPDISWYIGKIQELTYPWLPMFSSLLVSVTPWNDKLDYQPNQTTMGVGDQALTGSLACASLPSILCTVNSFPFPIIFISV